MNQKIFCIVLLLSLSTKVISNKIHPEARLPFPEYCSFFGYPSETHHVTTPDGYIL